MFPKNKPLRSKKHLDWIRNMPCSVCCAPPPSDPHHIRMRGNAGIGTKPPDTDCISLCREHHSLYHSQPFYFVELYGEPETYLKAIQKEHKTMV